MLGLKLDILDSMRFLKRSVQNGVLHCSHQVVTIFDSFIFEKNACRYSSVLGATVHVYLQENTPRNV